MPNIKSAIKRVSRNEKKRVLNVTHKSRLKSAIKSVEVAVAANDVEVAKSSLLAATKKIDKAASRGIIHKNAASRKKSRLAKSVNALSAQA